MRRTAIGFLMMGLFSCRPSFQDMINREKVTFQDAIGGRYIADLYVHKSKKPGAAVILWSRSPQEQKQWSETAARMAVQNYLILAGSMKAGQSEADSMQREVLALRAGRNFLTGTYPHLKIGLVGSEQACSACVLAGQADSSFAAAVLLTPAKEISLLDDADIQAWKGRPLLLIAAQQDPQWGVESTQRFYARIADPKKLVWLPGAIKGVDLLSSDLEPIIRRTIVLLFDRYLLGKK